MSVSPPEFPYWFVSVLAHKLQACGSWIACVPWRATQARYRFAMTSALPIASRRSFRMTSSASDLLGGQLTKGTR